MRHLVRSDDFLAIRPQFAGVLGGRQIGMNPDAVYLPFDTGQPSMTPTIQIALVGRSPRRFESFRE